MHRWRQRYCNTVHKPREVDFRVFPRLERLVLQNKCAVCPIGLPESLRLLLMESSEVYYYETACISFPSGLRAISFPEKDEPRKYQWSYEGARVCRLPASLCFCDVKNVSSNALNFLPHNLPELETLVCTFDQLTRTEPTWIPPPSLRYLIIDTRATAALLKIPDRFVNGKALEAVTILGLSETRKTQEEQLQKRWRPFSRRAEKFRASIDCDYEEGLLCTKGADIDRLISIGEKGFNKYSITWKMIASDNA